MFIRDLEVLGAAEELPLMVFGEQEYPEETRLKYRYLDLRREKLQKNMKMRSDVVASMRRPDVGVKGSGEFQTPIITASSPEGARDFWCHRACILVNSMRCHKHRSSSNS